MSDETSIKILPVNIQHFQDLENGDIHPSVADNLIKTGEFELAEGKNDKALTKFLKALEIMKTILHDILEKCRKKLHVERCPETNHPLTSLPIQMCKYNIASILHNIAIAHKRLHSYKKAIGSFEEALSFYDESFQLGKCQSQTKVESDGYYTTNVELGKPIDYDIKISETLSAMAYVHGLIKKTEKALECHKRIDSILRRTLFSSNSAEDSMTDYLLTQTSSTLSSGVDSFPKLDSLCADINDPKLQKRLLMIANNFNDMGNLYIVVGKEDSAVRSFKRSLEIYSTCISETNINREENMANCLSKLGSLYLKRKELDDATQSWGKALQIYFEIADGNEKDAMVLSGLNNIGLIHQERGELEDALKCFEMVYYIRYHNFRKDHPDLANSLNNIGNIHHKDGDVVKALNFYWKAVQIYRVAANTGTEKEKELYLCKMAGVSRNVGNLYIENGQLISALKIFEVALQIYQRFGGPNHIEVGRLSQKLGEIFSRMKDTQIASEHLNNALRIYCENRIPEDDPACITIRTILKIMNAKNHLHPKQSDIYEKKPNDNDIEKSQKANSSNIQSGIAKSSERSIVAKENDKTILEKDFPQLEGCTLDESQIQGGVLMSRTALQTSNKINTRVEQLQTSSIQLRKSSKKKEFISRTDLSSEKKQETWVIENKSESKGIDMSAEKTPNLTILDQSGVKEKEEKPSFHIRRDEKIIVQRDNTKDIKRENKKQEQSSTETKSKKNPQCFYLHGHNPRDNKERLKEEKRVISDDDDIGESGLVFDDHLANMIVVHGEMDENDLAKPFAEVLKVENIPSPVTPRPTKNEEEIDKIVREKRLEEWKSEIRLLNNVLSLQKSNPNNHPKVAETTSTIASLYVKMNELDKAMSLYKEALLIQKIIFGLESVDLASTLCNIANIYSLQNAFAISLEYYKEALRIKSIKLGEFHPDVGYILNQMGQIYLKSEDFDLSMDHHQHALAILTDTLGENNLAVIRTFGYIGAVVFRKGKKLGSSKSSVQSGVKSPKSSRAKNISLLDGSIDLEIYHKIGKAYLQMSLFSLGIRILKEVLLIQRQNNEDPETIASTLNTIGQAYRENGKYDEALKHHYQCLHLLRKVHDDCDRMIAITDMLIGVSEFCKGNFATATYMYENVLKVLKSLIGDDAPEVALVLRNMSEVKIKACDYSTAVHLLHDALRIQTFNLGVDHIETMTTKIKVGLVYAKQGKINEGIQLLNEVRVRQAELLVPEHCLVAETLQCIGTANGLKGDHSTAMKMYQEAFHMRKKLLGENHPDVANTLSSIGEVHMINGMPARALRAYEDVFRVQTDTLGADHADISRTLKNMGNAFYELKDYDKSMEKYNETLRIVEASFGKNIIMVADIYILKGNVSLRKAEFEVAKGEFSKALEIYRSLNLEYNDPKIVEVLETLKRVQHEEDLCV